jgi:hypothetical protein
MVNHDALRLLRQDDQQDVFFLKCVKTVIVHRVLHKEVDLLHRATDRLLNRVEHRPCYRVFTTPRSGLYKTAFSV